MADYKPGDTIWVHVKVLDVDTEGTDYTFCVESLGWVHDGNVRTAADFKDPLDDAIVAAAVEWFQFWTPAARDRQEVAFEQVDSKLYGAVEAKLDANRPKTAVDVVTDAMIDGHGRGIAEVATVHLIVKRLTEAGFIKTAEFLMDDQS